jgi:hypothetical protein
MKLSDFKEYLDKDNFTTKYFEHSKELPFDRLNLILPLKNHSNIVLEMLYTPGLGGILKDFKLLQYFVRLPLELDIEALEPVKSLILKLNMGIPLMGFGVNEDDQYAYFKTVSMVPNTNAVNDETLKVLVENVYMIGFIFDTFYDFIENVATGKKTLEETLRDLI